MKRNELSIQGIWISPWHGRVVCKP